MSAVRQGVAAVLAAALLLTACQAGPQPAEYAVSAGSSTGRTPRVTKLLVVVEENHSLSQMREGMPYAFGLAQQYGYANHYRALAHPSLPNYLAIVSGSTYGVRDDAGPAQHPLRGPSVFGEALAHGRTATVYSQGMQRRCQTEDAGTYAVRHNPWAYFVDERRQCRAGALPFSHFAAAARDGTLPRAGLLVPDPRHDAHDGTLREADDWFRDVMTEVFDGPDWQSGHLAVVLTADEDDRAHGNRVLTVVIHPSQDHNVVSAALDHYSLARLFAEVTRVEPLRQARDAASMADAFGLPVP